MGITNFGKNKILEVITNTNLKLQNFNTYLSDFDYTEKEHILNTTSRNQWMRELEDLGFSKNTRKYTHKGQTFYNDFLTYENHFIGWGNLNNKGYFFILNDNLQLVDLNITTRALKKVITSIKEKGKERDFGEILKIKCVRGQLFIIEKINNDIFLTKTNFIFEGNINIKVELFTIASFKINQNWDANNPEWDLTQLHTQLNNYWDFVINSDDNLRVDLAYYQEKKWVQNLDYKEFKIISFDTKEKKLIDINTINNTANINHQGLLFYNIDRFKLKTFLYDKKLKTTITYYNEYTNKPTVIQGNFNEVFLEYNFWYGKYTFGKHPAIIRGLFPRIHKDFRTWNFNQNDVQLLKAIKNFNSFDCNITITPDLNHKSFVSNSYGTFKDGLTITRYDYTQDNGLWPAETLKLDTTQKDMILQLICKENIPDVVWNFPEGRWVNKNKTQPIEDKLTQKDSWFYDQTNLVNPKIDEREYWALGDINQVAGWSDNLNTRLTSNLYDGFGSWNGGYDTINTDGSAWAGIWAQLNDALTSAANSWYWYKKKNYILYTLTPNKNYSKRVIELATYFNLPESANTAPWPFGTHGSWVKGMDTGINCAKWDMTLNFTCNLNEPAFYVIDYQQTDNQPVINCVSKPYREEINFQLSQNPILMIDENTFYYQTKHPDKNAMNPGDLNYFIYYINRDDGFQLNVKVIPQDMGYILNNNNSYITSAGKHGVGVVYQKLRSNSNYVDLQYEPDIVENPTNSLILVEQNKIFMYSIDEENEKIFSGVFPFDNSQPNSKPYFYADYDNWNKNFNMVRISGYEDELMKADINIRNYATNNNTILYNARLELTTMNDTPNNTWYLVNQTNNNFFIQNYQIDKTSIERKQLNFNLLFKWIDVNNNNSVLFRPSNTITSIFKDNITADIIQKPQIKTINFTLENGLIKPIDATNLIKTIQNEEALINLNIETYNKELVKKIEFINHNDEIIHTVDVPQYNPDNLLNIKTKIYFRD